MLGRYVSSLYRESSQRYYDQPRRLQMNFKTDIMFSFAFDIAEDGRFILFKEDSRSNKMNSCLVKSSVSQAVPMSLF